jgi:mannosyl-oligosaccharide glucosidase
MKKKTKETPVFGLMWYGQKKDIRTSKVNIDTLLKHECDQKNNIKYYWPCHNGVNYANEIINDIDNNINLNIENIKTAYDIKEQSWTTIIKGKKIKRTSKDRNFGLILYFSLEEFSLDKKVFFKPEKISDSNYKLIEMKLGNEFEKFDVEIVKGENGLKYSDYQKYRKGYQYNWRVKQFVLDDFIKMQETYVSKNNTYSYIPFDQLAKTKQPNIVAIQFVFSMDDLKDDDFEIIIRYSNNLSKEKESKEYLNTLINQRIAEFNNKFNELFKMKNLEKMNKNIYNLDESNSESLQQMSKEALSNILGGIGYFYGNIKEKINDNEQSSQKEKGLLTATPCRSYFARGFLWDEGFHQLIISKWDIELSLEMVNTWLDTMDNDGWIPREQIRGNEAENQVPSEFITQDKLIANPPTLLFPIKNFINNYKYFTDANSKIYGLKELLIKFYKKLKLWMNWFENTQRSILFKKKGEAYRYTYQWNKRDSSHNFPSGFDDLPRGMTPNDEENHLDLNIWILELEKTLHLLSTYFDKESTKIYEKNILERKKSIKSNLFSKDLNLFSDYLGPQFKRISVNKYPRKVFPYLWRNDNQCGENVKNPIGTKAECNPYSDSPCCSEFGWCGNTQNHCNCQKCSKSLKLEERREYKNKEKTYNPHIGYINLFPLFFGDFQRENLGDLFKYLSNKNEFMSDFGIRSLAKNDLLYHTGDDYWRGKIWIQMNYLALGGLYKYYIEFNEDAEKIYEKVRNGVIKAVYNSWIKTHTFYENYYDITGKGVMNNPFNGWTSTILLILSENYD